MTPPTASLEAAQALHNAGRFAEADQIYAQLLQSNPANADLWALSGTLAVQVGRHEVAVQRLQRALALNPRSPAYLVNIGLAYQALGRLADARAAFDAAVTAKPDLAEAYLNRGLIDYALGRHRAALADFTRTISLRADMAVAYVNRGVVHQALGDQAAALVDFDRAIAINPDYAEVHSNRGAALQELKRYDEALASHDKAVALAPALAAAYANRAATLVRLERPREALRDADRALALAPDYPEATLNRGNSLLKLGDLEGFVANCRRAAEFKPDYADAHRNASLGLLLLGRYAEAWPGYEWRWKCTDLALGPRPFTQPRWDGRRELGGALLIWGEQGVGDEILYGSMVDDLSAAGMKIVREVDARLVPLLTRSSPGIRAVARRQEPDPATLAPEIVAQIPAGSLGQFVRPDLAAFPKARRGYLRADMERAARYRHSLMADAPAGERLIGLSWISKNPSSGVHKTAPLAAWSPLLKVPGVRFVDLQYGDTAQERADVARDVGVAVHHRDDLDLFGDLDGLASLIAACDLVITVSNTTAHLAGALGAPTWVLVPHGNGQFWYWGHEGAATPWYPSISLYRQPESGKWDEPIAAVARDLAGFRP